MNIRKAKTLKVSKRKFLIALVYGVVLAAAPPALSATFAVSPSGDRTGVADQANIKSALEAAKNGGTVELAAGTFYLHKSIVVFDFDGIFKGAGRTLTTVQTAPSIDFDVSEAADLFRSSRPSITASMFLFPYNPGSDARTFRISDMKIFVSEPGVDPPEAGIADSRRTFLRNAMGVVMVVNVDALRFFFGAPPDTLDTINLDATVERLDIEGIQDPKFRGFWDEFSYDSDNSIGGAIVIWGPSTGTGATVKDVHVVNADIALNLSGNPSAVVGGSEADGCVIENAILGIENFFTRTIVSHNELNGRIPILLIEAPNNRIEQNTITVSHSSGIPIVLNNSPNSLIDANSISGDGFMPIKVLRSPNTDISNNFVTGNWAYGINPVDGSNDCTITGNLLGETKDGQKPGMSSLFGTISIERSNNCTVSGNKFVNVNSPGLGAVWVHGALNRVENNDYTESGLPGWNSGPGAIMVARFMEATFDGGSITNHVFETQYPEGTDVCDQVLGLEGNNVQALIDGSEVGINAERCPTAPTPEEFAELNADLLQQMADTQDQRQKGWIASREAQ